MKYGQQGQDVSDQDTIKEQVLDALVERELIMQDATEQGIDVSEKDVESELDTIKSENEEQFTMVLDQFNLTEDDYKEQLDRKSTRLNSSHVAISYAVFCLKKKKSCEKGDYHPT